MAYLHRTLRRAWLLPLLLALPGPAATSMAQIRPATITSVTPAGAQRGNTITLTVEGANLANAVAVAFSHPGIRAEITNVIELPFQSIVRPKGFTGAPIEDLYALHRVLVKVYIDETTPVGRHNFRIKTPLGTTNMGSLWVGSLTEIPEAEPNNTSSDAHKIFFPSTVVGTVNRPGDEDLFEFEAEVGGSIVFDVLASALGSSLDSQLTLLDEESNVLAANNDLRGRADSFLHHTFSRGGTYRIRVADATGSGSGRHFYRLNIGTLPYLTHVFPLGVRRGTSSEPGLAGYNLEGAEKFRVAAPSNADPGDTLIIQPKVRGRESLNFLRVAIGEHPEILETEGNDRPSSAQPVSLPVCINGRIDGSGRAADQDLFRFSAKKGQRIALTVLASRLGSPLDSILEILDSESRRVPRVVARPVWQTFVTLNDPGSLQRGMRIDSWSALSIGDYVMVGNELVQVEELPKNPDDDIKFRSYRGVRIGYEGTTPEAHAMNTPVYRVQLHSPGKTFPPNGMPLFSIDYVNDDGGQNFGKDSHLMFESPADGEYFVRIRDIRNFQGADFAYRLTLAEPKPDFTLTVDPKNPNIPAGDAIPLTVIVTRLDGFDGAVELETLDLPPGVASAPGRILPGAANAVLVLRAEADAQLPATPVRIRVRGKSELQGKIAERWADISASSDENVSWLTIAQTPELLVTSVEPRELVLEPGGQAPVTVTIRRQRGFAGRVPVDVRNLPYGVIIPDIGLNGILITESETHRAFHVQVDPKTGPLEQTLYLVGRIETNSPNSTEHASAAVRLKVVSKKAQVSQK